MYARPGAEGSVLDPLFVIPLLRDMESSSPPKVSALVSSSQCTKRTEPQSSLPFWKCHGTKVSTGWGWSQITHQQYQTNAGAGVQRLSSSPLTSESKGWTQDVCLQMQSISMIVGKCGDGDISTQQPIKFHLLPFMLLCADWLELIKDLAKALLSCSYLQS